MATYNTFEPILQGAEATESNAIDYARGMCWGECFANKQSIGHADFVEKINGVGIYYDYAADYYFFTDESE